MQSVKFGSDKRQFLGIDSEKMEGPGPGNYDDSNIKGFGKGSLAVSIRGKPKDNKVNGHPGPGAYDGNSSMIKAKSQAAKIG